MIDLKSILHEWKKTTSAAPQAGKGVLIELVRKEIVSHILTLRFTVTFSLILVLVFLGVYSSTQEFRQSRSEQASVTRRAEASVERIAQLQRNNEDKWSMLFTRIGVTRAINLPPLSFLSKGLSTSWPVALNVKGGYSTAAGAFGTTTNIERSTSHSPLGRLFQTPDFVYVVNLVLSFLALLLVFDAICGEKQAGTLRLMLTNPVPRHLILVSKWLAACAIIMAPFLVAFVGSIGYASIVGAVQISWGTIKLLIAFFVAACLFISVFFTLGLAISAFTHRATTALFIGLFTWTLWLLVIPNLAPAIGDVLSPAPSKRKIDAEKSQVDVETELLLGRLQTEDDGFVGGTKARNKTEDVMNEGRQKKDSWDRFYRQVVERQAGIAGFIGRLSPSASWIYASSALTGTGASAYYRILEAQKRMEQDLADHQHGVYMQQHTVGKLPDFNLGNLPLLKIDYPDANRAIAESLNDILLLFILNVVLFMVSFVGFLRYDVR